jgi:DNA-binding transcriptional ArsR family regulator
MVMGRGGGRLDGILSALSDPTRRSIVEALRFGEASVAEVAAPFAMSQPAVSKHLAVLERAGLISRHRVARKNMCRLEAQALEPLSRWVDDYRRFWEGSLVRLDAYLACATEELDR